LTNIAFVSLSPPKRGEGCAKRQERGAFEIWQRHFVLVKSAPPLPGPLPRFAAEREIIAGFAEVPVVMITNRITIKIGKALKIGCANCF
jgi:hypothetical protein